ncbi:hypothetical protein N7492_006565 [Penicillium capsulatum]|uniref:Uncharacterized protein n=1 Tax=Penicillium capsulatum TaxID=69766 RepID=A0A9W9I0G8_9EURO|nr:hypothetical protein N7492_006565 [Penicillium capsulatum]KAJ6116401.1 hypothetical protein N7512_006126 [Penicillium capsulatum]
MECASQRCLKTWRILIFRQLTLAHQPRHARRALSSSCAQRAETDEASPLTVDRPHSDSNNLRPSQRLPQSPIVAHSGQRKKQRKRQPTREDLEPLAKNPWALALASPVRQCTATGARLPRALLGEWGLVKRPGTESNYMLPVSVLQDYIGGKRVSVSASTSESGKSIPEKPDEHGQSSVSGATRENPQRRLVFRMSNNYHLQEVLTKRLPMLSSKVPLAARLLSFRWRHPQGPITPHEEKNIVWRKDMPEYLLQRMREDVIKKIEKVCLSYPVVGAEDGVWNILDHNERGGSIVADSLQRLKTVDRMECGAIITLSPPDALTPQEKLPHNGPISGGVWMLPEIHQCVPYFNLSVLLGPELMKLRDGIAAQHFKSPCLFFRPDDDEGVEALLALCRLDHYISQRSSSTK